MAELSVKMGVSGVSQFIQSMNSAGASVKTIDAALKQNEQQLKATGDATTYLQQKQQLLQGKLKEQKKAIEEAQKALKKLDEDGADKAGKAFQDMQRKLLNAQTAMMETQQQIEDLGSASVEAAGETDKLSSSLTGLNKKVSLDQVISGINSITNVMEKAASAAFRLGTQIWDNIMDSARLGDDIATQATILGMDTTTYQQYKGVFDTIAEVTISDWTRAKRTLQKVLNDPSNDQIDAMKALGFGNYVDKYGVVRTKKIADNWEDALWVLADELRSRVESGELSEDMADIYGQALFGKNYSSLKPLFKLGKEGFAEALGDVSTASEEAVENAGELNDTVLKLQQSFEALKLELLGEIAPYLTDAVKAIDELLGRIQEYLKTPEGQELLENLGTAISGMISDIGEIDPEGVVNTFSTIFSGIVDSFTWLTEHWEDVKNALAGIAIGFGMLKVTSLGLNIVKMIDGFRTLFGGGGGGNGGTPTGTGTGGGSGVWLTATKLASNLASNLTMYDPTGSAALIKDAVMDLTTYGWERKTGKSVGEALRAEWGEITKGLDAEGIAASAEAAKKYWLEDAPNALWGIFGFKSAKEGATKVSNNLAAMNGYVIDQEITADEAMRIINGEPIDMVLNPVVEDGAEQIQEQVGTVTIPVQLNVNGSGLVSSVMDAVLGMVPGGSSNGKGFANGLPWVPFDGYAAILHKGERVLTASENKSYTYNNNNYFGSVNLNNGQDIEALCDSIDRHNRRRQSGFGE